MSSLSSLPLNDVALVPFPTSYTTNTSWQDRVFSQDSSSVTSQSTKLSHSRSSSQSKSMAHLGLIPKPIRTRSITDAKQLPVEVWNLWREIMNASYHEGVVPREIQEVFTEHIPDARRVWFSEGVSQFDPDMLQSELRELLDIVKRTLNFREEPASEASWNCDVHSRILRQIVKHVPGIQQENITTAKPLKHLIPYDQKGVNVDAKLVDFTLTLDHDAGISRRLVADRLTLEHQHRRARSSQSINHTVDSCQRLMTRSIAVNIEMKTPEASESDAVVQISLWAATHFNRLRELLVSHSTLTTPIQMPLPLIVLVGGEWRLYFAADREREIDILGSHQFGSTETLLGCYQVLAVGTKICQWVKDVYAPGFVETCCALD